MRIVDASFEPPSNWRQTARFVDTTRHLLVKCVHPRMNRSAAPRAEPFQRTRGRQERTYCALPSPLRRNSRDIYAPVSIKRNRMLVDK